MQSPHFGALVLAARIGEPGKLPEVGVKKPAEPHALAFSSSSDTVHPIVPVSRADQRQAVVAHCQTAVERARAMLEQSGALRGHTGLEVRLVLLSRENRPIEEGNDLVEKTNIAGYFKVMDDRVRQP